MLLMSFYSTVLAAVKARLPAISRQNLGFAVRTTAASFIALYLALLIGLDDPKWAPMTVWIVAQGNRGMSLSKGKWRFVGTVIGAGIGAALIPLFVRAPVSAMVVLAVWVGLCTALSTGLRNFRVYGAVLAGYTAAVVAMDSVGDPAHVFDIALARVAYIGLGIVVEAVLAFIFATDDPLSEIRERLGNFLGQAAKLSATALKDHVSSDAMRKLFAAALGVDTAAGYAAATSMQLRRRLGHLRSAMVAALQQIAAARELRLQIAGQPLQHDPLVIETGALLDRIGTDNPPQSADLEALTAQIDTALATETARAQGTLPARLLMLFRLRDLVSNFARARSRAAQFDRPDAPAARVRFAFHIDRTAAVQNGIRAATATLIAACIWLATGWAMGPIFVIIVAVIAALFATRPNPVASSFGFLKGTFIAVIGAAICKFVVLPLMPGYVPLLVLVAIIMVPVGIAMQKPSTAASASIFAIFFMDMIGIDGTVQVDALLFIHGAIALLGGMLTGAAVFAWVLPADPVAARRRLHQAVRGDLAAIGRHAGRWSVEAWVSRTADRVEQQIVTGARIGTEQAERELREVLAMLSLGSAAIRLHRLGSGDPAMSRPIGAVLRALAALDPDRLTRTARRSSTRLARLATGSDERAARRLQAAALLNDVKEAAQVHTAFLAPIARASTPSDGHPATTGVAPHSAAPTQDPSGISAAASNDNALLASVQTEPS